MDDYNLTNDGKYLNENEVKGLMEKREKQILTRSQFINEVVSKSKLIRCLNPESDNKVFVYFAKEGLETDTPIHLYNNEGELIMTFPWNGEVNPSMGKYNLEYVDREVSKNAHGPVVVSPVKEFKLTATESGNIFVNTVRKGNAFNLTVQTQLDYQGKRKHVSMPSFKADQYPNKEVAGKVKEYLSKNKDDGIVFAGAAFGGDAFIEYGKKNSYMI
jgi:hypothetical protein